MVFVEGKFYPLSMGVVLTSQPILFLLSSKNTNISINFCIFTNNLLFTLLTHKTPLETTIISYHHSPFLFSQKTH
jgi:hypothetical protein